MAAWQFQFSLVPVAGIRRVHGEVVRILPEYRTHIFSAPVKEASDFENYWDGIEMLPAAVEVLKGLLPERVSWSGDAKMFGSEDGNSIEIWEDDINCCLDIRSFDLSLLESLVGIAQMTKCMIVLKDDGRVIDPVLVSIVDEARRSSAAKFLENPSAFISQRAQIVP
jgi:hypothetical protein